MPSTAEGAATKAARQYHSPTRAQGAAATRRKILDAAMRLFLEYGFGKVTVVEIAKEAAVALPTLYANIGGKATILSTLIDEAVTDPIVDETFSAILDSHSTRGVIEAAAHGTRVFNERSRDIMQVMKAAAAIDGTAGDMLLRTSEVYQRRLSRVAQTLRKLHDTGLTNKEATDVLWFYFGQDAWHVLVAQRHWGWDKAERWLAAQAFAAFTGGSLIAPAERRPRSGR